MIFVLGTELHGLRPTAGGAGELATLPVARSFLPLELRPLEVGGNVPTAAQEPILETIQPELDHEFANNRRGVRTDGTALACELVRTVFTAPGEARLYRLATTLIALPLNEDGTPAGPAVDVNTFADPFSDPIPHPNFPFLNALRVTWYLIWDTDRIAYSETPLQTTLEVNIPRGVGIPNMPEQWTDFRYAWQSRYSDERRTTHLPEGFGRLWVVLDAPADRWSVRAGGLLTLSLARKRPRRDMPGVITK